MKHRLTALAFLIFGLFVLSATPAQSAVPGIQNTGSYKGLSTYVQALEKRSKAKVKTTAAQKTQFYKTLNDKVKATNKVAYELMAKRKKPLWKKNREAFKRKKATIARAANREIATLKLEFDQQTIENKQALKKEIRDIHADYVEQLQPLKKAVTKAKRTLKIKAKKNWSKSKRKALRKKKAQAKQVIAEKQPRLNKIIAKRDVFIQEAKDRYVAEEKIRLNELENEIAEIRLDQNAAVKEADADLKASFNEKQLTKLIAKRSTELQMIGTLKSRGQNAIKTMTAAK